MTPNDLQEMLSLMERLWRALSKADAPMGRRTQPMMHQNVIGEAKRFLKKYEPAKKTRPKP